MNQVMEAADYLASVQLSARDEFVGVYDFSDRSETEAASMLPFVLLVDSHWTTPARHAFRRVALAADPDTSLGVRWSKRFCQLAATENTGAWTQFSCGELEKRPSRNLAAIALLKSWLEEADDVNEQAESLQETIRSLNELRDTQRKLFR